MPGTNGSGSSLSERGVLERQLAKALYSVEQGELSHVARELCSSGLAPGFQATLDWLRDSASRPVELSESVSENAVSLVPEAPIELHKRPTSKVLRSSSRGLSAGNIPNRSEYLKLCTVFNLFYRTVCRLA